MAILLKSSTGKWVEPQLVGFAKEQELQSLLADSPELIERAGEGTLIFTSETALAGSGYADLIGVASNGEILIIETKLASNPDIRRTVIGQILEYAAFLWESDYGLVDDFFRRKGGMGMYELLKTRTPDLDEEGFRSAVESCLENGRFTLLVAVDSVTEELRRVLQYTASVAAGMRLEAIEVRRHRNEDVDFLEIQRYGIPSPSPKGVARLTIGEVLSKSPDELTRKKIELILNLWQEAGYIVKANKESVSCSAGLPRKIVTMFWASPGNSYQLQMNFLSMRDSGMPDATLDELRTELSAIDEFPSGALLTAAQPTIPFSILTEPTIRRFVALVSSATEKWRIALQNSN